MVCEQVSSQDTAHTCVTHDSHTAGCGMPYQGASGGREVSRGLGSVPSQCTYKPGGGLLAFPHLRGGDRNTVSPQIYDCAWLTNHLPGETIRIILIKICISKPIVKLNYMGHEEHPHASHSHF
jgi:hypothetical protein